MTIEAGDLFDPWEYLGAQRRCLLERSWAGVFREYLLEHLPVSELVPHFRDGFGRPSKDLFVALGALVLQQLHDLTDQQTSEAVALNIAWHYALDIRHEPDAYLCERTLRNYRSKVLELGLDEVLFRTLTDQLISAVGVDTTRQRLDSTAVRSAIRGLTRLSEGALKSARDGRVKIGRCTDVACAVVSLCHRMPGKFQTRGARLAEFGLSRRCVTMCVPGETESGSAEEQPDKG